MKKNAANDDWTERHGRVTVADIKRLRNGIAISKLSLTETPTLTARLAQALATLPAVDRLWLWCDVTRTAMRHVLAIPELRILDVLAIVKPGPLDGFSTAGHLEVFRGNGCLTEADLFEISRCMPLRELGAQGAKVSPQAIDAILTLPRLETLDVEGSAFNDVMAAQVSASTSLTSLDVGSTRITGAGLRSICKMTQLRSLDLWATAITEDDLDFLARLPNLEYLSVGDCEGDSTFHGESLLPRLAAIGSLKRVWLDGVSLDASHAEILAARYESVRIT